MKTMWTDPIVEETRRIRDEHAKFYNYDLRAIFDDLKLFEQSLTTSCNFSDAKQTPGKQKDKTGNRVFP